MRQWHLMPYRLLLPIQICFLALMALIEVSLFLGWGPLAGAEPAVYGQALSLLVLTPVAFFLNKRWTFRDRPALK